MANRTSLLTTLKKFLTFHWDKKAPLLLACSGGPDSKALLYLLDHLRKDKEFIELRVHVAHIDHGWREESKSEALALKAEVSSLNFPFHLHTLTDTPRKENAARETRYAFLRRAAQEIGAQAVMLGHQMEDQAETVLKRVLEGAAITACRGMRSVSGREGLALWRPLLGVPKKELVAWLEEGGVSFVQDATNLSSNYLRGRFRSEMFPSLERAFGKSVVKNLCRLGERAGMLERYLDGMVEPLWDRVGGESEVCLGELRELDEIVLEYFLRRWVKKLRLSLDQLQVLVRMVKTGDREVRVEARGHELRIERGKLALKKLYDYLEQ